MNEFFADVISILYTENPQAESEALHFATGSRFRREKGTDRNFDTVRNPTVWKKSEPHVMLSPTRSWVWKYCFDGPRLRLLAQRGLKGYAARKILEAIGSEIDARYLARQFEMPIAMASLRLQKSIDRAMVDPVTGKSLCHN